MRWIWTGIFGLILLFGAAGAWWVFLAPPRVTVLSVAAGERGSDSHTLMGEIAEVLERHSDTLRLDVRTSANASSSISRINRGDVDLAAIRSNTPAYANINLVVDLFADYFLLMTRAGSTFSGQRQPLDRVTDLPSHSIAIPESGSSGNLSFWSIIDHYKVPPESIRTRALPRAKAAEAFITGQVDAFFLVSSIRDPFLLDFLEETVERGIGVAFLPIDQAQAMTLKRPYLEPSTIVKGAFDGSIPLPRSNIMTASLHRILVTSDSTDEEAIGELVRTIFENRLDLLMRMTLSSSLRDPRQEATASLPLHPGAARFYDRDQPSFLHENAEPMALIVTTTAMLLSALIALRRSLLARAKNRGDDYNSKLVALTGRARRCDDPVMLEAMKQELHEMLEIAVEALDTDQVTEEAFQSFSFLWASARDTVQEQLAKHG